MATQLLFDPGNVRFSYSQVGGAAPETTVMKLAVGPARLTDPHHPQRLLTTENTPAPAPSLATDSRHVTGNDLVHNTLCNIISGLSLQG
jgi:hypothetical protein